jgi:Ankyrin repeat
MADIRGRTILHVATRNDHTETITALIYRDTNVNAAGEDRLIIFKLADNNGHIEM